MRDRQLAKTADRLRARLQKALGSSGAKSKPTSNGDGPSISSSAELAPIAREGEPESEGGLLVWREKFFLESGADRETRRDLFGKDSADDEFPARFSSTLLSHGMELGDIALVDIETCGLADDPIFLVGVAYRSSDAGEIVLEQFFAPDPTAEPEMLRRSVEVLDERSVWVSFNGRSFDIPRMRRRAGTHRIEFPESRQHVDLLHAVRKVWKGELPNCKLSTVEQSLLGLERLPGDVPGREVPQRYWDFVGGGERRWVEPVIEHNRRDVIALIVLLRRVLEASGVEVDQGSGKISISVPDLRSAVTPPTRTRNRRPSAGNR